MAIPKWSPKSPEWSSETYSILVDNQFEDIPQQTVEDIMMKSEAFPITFPVDTARCKILKNFVQEKILERNINSVYPVIHENVLELCCKFILFKRKHGTSNEKKIYKEMSLKNFIDRLLRNRAVIFIGAYDEFLLLDQRTGAGKWESIGTDKESHPLIIKDYLSYDEIKLSVFLSVSSYTYFVNEGERTNKGVLSKKRDNIADEGIIIGLIGPRLKKRGVMEYQEIVSTKNQNTKQNGYGRKVKASMPKLFSEFYEEVCMDYEETLKCTKSDDERYTTLIDGSIFDNHYYYKRLTMSIDTLLADANHRADVAKKTAFIHVVGIGLGVWKISAHQEKVYMEAFAERILAFGENLHSVSDICFAYINHPKCGNYEHDEIFELGGHPLGGIKIHILKRNPHEKVLEGKLLVVSYAWDGNSLPGNEYWFGSLESSSDPAAACSTQVAELHNPHINPLVRADQLKVVKNGKIVSFEEYQKLIRSDKFD